MLSPSPSPSAALPALTAGGQFDVDGKLYSQLKLTSIVDGFNSPITAGNFVDLVNRGFYNGMKVQRSDRPVVQTSGRMLMRRASPTDGRFSAPMALSCRRATRPQRVSALHLNSISARSRDQTPNPHGTLSRTHTRTRTGPETRQGRDEERLRA